MMATAGSWNMQECKNSAFCSSWK